MSQQSSSVSELLETAKFYIIKRGNITIHRESLGRGSYGTVYTAVYDGKPCVVKEIHPFLRSVTHNHSPLKLVFKEINTLSSLRHPSIVQFLGVYFKQEGSSDDSSMPILVMERMWKNLYAVLEHHPKQLSLVNRVHILHDVACGLQYLHNKKTPIFHRDLNANNILLTKNLEAKIADLGQARELIDGNRLSTAPGNTIHMPPEALVHNPTYDSTLDIFSFGCITIHTVTEKLPIPTDQYIQTENVNMFVKRTEAERRQEYLDLMDDYSELQKIAIQCIDNTPAERSNACQICNRLQEYIKKLETELPTLVKQHEQDKLSLIHSNKEAKKELESNHQTHILEKENYISSLKSQLHDSESKFEEDKAAFEMEKNSLQMKLEERDEMSKEISRIFQDQVDKLQEECKAYNVTYVQLQQQIQDLKKQLEQEKCNMLLEKQNLQDELQITKDKNQKERLDFQNEKESLQNVNKQLVLDNQLLKDKLRTEVTNVKQELNLNIEREREVFQRKSREQEASLITYQTELDKLKIDKEQLEEIFCRSVQETEALQKKLDEQQMECQTLQNELKSKAADLKVLQNRQKITDLGSRLHQKLLEIESAQRDDRLSLLTVIRQQEENITKLQAQLSDLRNKFLTQKQQLEQKSYRLSTLESSFSEFQGSSHSKEEKMKSLEEDYATLKKQLENNDKIQRHFEKELISKNELLKRREEELQLQKKEIIKIHNKYKKEIDNLRGDLHKDITMYKSQIASQEEINCLLKKEAEYQSDLVKNMEDRFQKLDNEQKTFAMSEKNLKRQIMHKDVDIKENAKRIESLEQNCSNSYSRGYNYDFHWYPYLSLPVKLIRPSAALVKDKVFVTGSYQSTNPQGKKLEDFSEDNSIIFCFYTAECHCDMIPSPVMLGALASVNDQCVLVSGADSVGNTLTGKVYVLCEEGSLDTWKEFSKPLPTPRMLACTCCYGNRWLVVCGGFSLMLKEESSVLEAVNVVEILDISKGEWYTLPEERSPAFSTILCCAIVGEELYVVGRDQVIKTSCNSLIKAATSNNALVWDNVQIEVEGPIGNLYPFSAIEVNGEPMIIASMTDSVDDVTCVLMKNMRGSWKILSKAVECQHCSAAVVTSSLELLLFGGSAKVSSDEAVDISCKSSLIPTLNIHDEAVVSQVNALNFEPIPAAVQGSSLPDTQPPATVNFQPPNLSFIGPIHTVQFDQKGGAFQSPIHQISLVVPPNALNDGEKVTVHMGATTSGPFDLPEDCKFRSAVVWLSVSPSLQRSISVIVPHSAIFTSPQHHGMMRFVTCKDCKGPRYKFNSSSYQYEVDEEEGVLELNESTMVAIITSPKFAHDQEDEEVSEGIDSDDDFQDAPEDIESLATPIAPPACFIAKLFWPRGELPRSFRADIYYIQNLPTELYKVDTVYKKEYYEENGTYPEIVDTKFILDADEVKCVLPCDGSNKCDCMRGWDMIQMQDSSDVQIYEEHVRHHSNGQSRFSVKFTCNSGAPLTCCLEFLGAKMLSKTRSVDLMPPCLQKHFTNNATPFIVERGIQHCSQITVPIQEPAEEKLHPHVPIKEPAVEKLHAHDTIHNNSHEVANGIVTESPPLKNLL